MQEIIAQSYYIISIIGNDWRGRIPHTHNKNQTKEVDRAHSKRRITVKTAIEGKMLGKRSRGRPRQMMLDWMMVEGYRKLKE